MLTRKNSYKAVLKRDAIVASIVFGGLIVARYLLPFIIGDIIAFALLAIFFFDKKNNGFYFALFLLIIAAPGMLFYHSGVYAMPSLEVPGFGRQIFFSELISFTILLKAILKGHKVFFFYRKHIIVIIIYAIFLLLIGYINGLNVYKALKTIREVTPLFLFLAIPSLLNDKQEIVHFIGLIFIFAIFCFISQLVDVITGIPIAGHLGETFMFGRELKDIDIEMFNMKQGPIRTFYGQFIMIIAFSLSLFYILQNNTVFKRVFLNFIAFVCFLSVVICATRGWIIGFSIILIVFLFIKASSIKTVIFGFLLLLFMVFISPILKKQLDLALDRFSTVQLLLEGDVTAGGTLSRIDDRSPSVLKKFNEKPVFGWGFSEEYYKYADGHVGNQNLLLNAGIIGYFIFLVFWLSFLKYCLKNYNIYTRAELIFGATLLGIFFIHSSSRFMFSYAMGTETSFGLSIFFYITNVYINENRVTYKKH